MSLNPFLRLIRPAKRKPHRKVHACLRVNVLEARDVPAGYLAIGAGPGGLPGVAIRVDIQDQVAGSPPNSLGQPAAAQSDGKTDFTSQIFFPFPTGFRGGVHTATGNFDGLYATPDSLVTAAGPGGGPHVIIWRMKQLASGAIVTDGIEDQFFAYDARFRGGVNVACGDLDGDGRAEIITGAGPGGGPHVRVWKQINGHFQMVNEFFAFDLNFRGGVSVASGQGYKTVQQLRLVLDKQYAPGEINIPPYQPANGPVPGTNQGVPLLGLDYTVPAGSTEPFFNFYGATGTPRIVPKGAEGHFDDMGNPLTYVTIASGVEQYLSGNLLNSLGNSIYRPVNNVPAPNPNNIGKLTIATWTQAPPPGFQADVPYLMEIIGKTTDGKDVVTRLTTPPDQVTFKNQLVIGAGPGGGPHVKIYDFAATAGGQLINNGVGKEFFAFDPSFRGGVNVGVGNVIEHQSLPSDRFPCPRTRWDSRPVPHRSRCSPAELITRRPRRGSCTTPPTTAGPRSSRRCHSTRSCSDGPSPRASAAWPAADPGT